MIEEERRIEWCLILNKKDEICLLIDLIHSLANNEDSLLLNLSTDSILEQFTKILYHDSLNRVEQLIFTRLLHKNKLILLIKCTLRT